jgi:hypothetical protein
MLLDLIAPMLTITRRRAARPSWRRAQQASLRSKRSDLYPDYDPVLAQFERECG